MTNFVVSVETQWAGGLQFIIVYSFGFMRLVIELIKMMWIKKLSLSLKGFFKKKKFGNGFGQNKVKLKFLRKWMIDPRILM